MRVGTRTVQSYIQIQCHSGFVSSAAYVIGPACHRQATCRSATVYEPLIRGIHKDRARGLRSRRYMSGCSPPTSILTYHERVQAGPLMNSCCGTVAGTAVVSTASQLHRPGAFVANLSVHSFAQRCHPTKLARVSCCPTYSANATSASATL